MTNPYAPPAATVDDIADPLDTTTPADRGTRLVAAILDGIIASMMVYLPALVGLAVTGGFSTLANLAEGRDTSFAAIGVAVILGFFGFVAWAVLTIKYVLENRQTIAKRLLNIKVVRSDGTPVSVGRLFWLRNVVNALLAFIPLYGIVDHLFIFGESRQCLHDKIADTIVVKA